MRIAADHQRCEGHGLCAVTAPQVYDLDDDGNVVVLVGETSDVPKNLEEAAEAGAQSCPVAALTIAT